MATLGRVEVTTCVCDPRDSAASFVEGSSERSALTTTTPERTPTANGQRLAARTAFTLRGSQGWNVTSVRCCHLRSFLLRRAIRPLDFHRRRSKSAAIRNGAIGTLSNAIGVSASGGAGVVSSFAGRVSLMSISDGNSVSGSTRGFKSRFGSLVGTILLTFILTIADGNRFFSFFIELCTRGTVQPVGRQGVSGNRRAAGEANRYTRRSFSTTNSRISEAICLSRRSRQSWVS